MSDKNNKNNNTEYLPIGMCLGMSVGMAIGAAFDNIPVGMCMGLGCGSLLGSVITLIQSKKTDSNDKDDPGE